MRYDNRDLSKCLDCKGNIPFNTVTGTCDPTDGVIVACQRVVVKNGIVVCDKCPNGYNLVLANSVNICLKRVNFCKSQNSATGKCNSCVDGYDL